MKKSVVFAFLLLQKCLNTLPGTAPVSHWLRICLPAQRTRVQPLVRRKGEPHLLGAARHTCSGAGAPQWEDLSAATKSPPGTAKWMNVCFRPFPPPHTTRVSKKTAVTMYSPWPPFSLLKRNIFNLSRFPRFTCPQNILQMILPNLLTLPMGKMIPYRGEPHS